MEKSIGYAALPGPTIRNKQHKNKLVIGFIILASILNVAYSWYGNRPFSKAVAEVPHFKHDEFNWSQLQAKQYINYTPCFSKFECSRLDLPMDYNSTGPNGSRVKVAVIRYPAPVAITDPRYAGPLLINPGGPGGSGVSALMEIAELISAVVNPAASSSSDVDAKFYDIVSWDPRGINNTLPQLNCFPDASSVDAHKLQTEAEGFDRDSNTAFSHVWARSKATGATCSTREEITQHLNTAAVVNDMVQIIERHGEWRSQQAEKWLSTKDGLVNSRGKARCHKYSKESVLERTRWRKGEEKLAYWGFSYGTLLGATFASMEPKRAERMILDGVVDSDDYYGTGWLTNLRDTDNIMDKFYEYCSQGGTEKCALNSGNSTSSDIKHLIESLISSLKKEPIAIPGSKIRGPDIVTYSDAIRAIKDSLYNSLKEFPLMAILFNDLINGSGAAFANWKEKQHVRSCPLQNCNLKTSADCHPMGREITTAILCSDGKNISNQTKQDALKNADTLFKQSKWLGEFWAGIALPCTHWKAEAALKLTAADIKGNTSHPILLLGNTLDPVTPVYNAHTMSKKFPGSVVLEQNSEGHCTLSSPSLCTTKYVRAFFQTGALPEPGVICQPEELPLLGKTDMLRTLSVEDQNLVAAMMKVLESTSHRFGPLSPF